MSVGGIAVSRQPQQIRTTDAAKDSVTLFNGGPATVNLSGDSGTATSPYNSFRLPPLGTMTWKKSRDLWAATSLPDPLDDLLAGYDPRATLVVSGDGDLSVANNENSDIIIATGSLAAGAATLSIPFESAPFKTIRIVLTGVNTPGFVEITDMAGATIWWSSGQQRTGSSSATTFPAYFPSASRRAVMVTKRVLAAYGIALITAPDKTPVTYTVYGSMRDAPDSIRMEQGAYASAPIGFMASSGTSDSYYVSNMNLATANFLNITPAAPKLTLTVSNVTALGAGGYLAIVSRFSSIYHGFMPLTNIAVNQANMQTFDLSPDQGYYVTATGTGTVNVGGSFHP